MRHSLAALTITVTAAALGVTITALAAACGGTADVDVDADDAAVRVEDGDGVVGELTDAVDDAADPNEPDDLAEDVDVDDAGDEGASVQALAAAAQYRNPLGPNCADPGVIKIAGADGPTFWVACTGGNYPLFTSRDLVHWTRAGNIFTAATKPHWGSGNFWAPEVHRVGNQLVAYFSAIRASTGRMCIGAAHADRMEGPWHDLGHPLVCDSHFGLIDANVHTDAATGISYLYYKTDGNGHHPQEPTTIFGTRLTQNGLGLVGARHALIRNTLSWEAAVVEGAYVVHRGSYFYMFYSGATYCNGTYAVGVARSHSPLGPFTKKGAPILHSNGTWAGPGHNSFVRAGGQPWLVYHAWDGPHTCADGGSRKLLLDRVTWSGGWPVIGSGTPSTTSRTAPVVP